MNDKDNLTSLELDGVADAGSYSNVFGFLGAPLTRAVDKLGGAVVVGIPYDLATSARPGARFGPAGIRQASAQLRWERKRWPWDFALRSRLALADYGDIDFRVGDSADMHARLRDVSARLHAGGNFMLGLGGDHYATLPIVEGVCQRAGQVALIHFDAHSDTEVSDLPYYHGSMFHRAIQDGLIDPRASIQLGIRTENNSADLGLSVLDADWLNGHGADEACAQIRQVVGERPAYLSIDIDCLDPSSAPGTGTPVAGGLTTSKLLQILRGLQGMTLLGADVMEVAPAYDHADITTLAAATLAVEILYVHASSHP
ncbi:MAG: agmatinase [Proteobacteria bacterium]|nr:agmatinase [Pseudomonadota bacterium]